MVIVEPFTFIRTTAFKERMQLAEKINEIIDAIYPIDPETINDIDARLDALELADTTISGRITTLDAQNVKIATEQTITGKKILTNVANDIIVKDAPSGTHSAVNVTYVSKTDGTNNLLHTAGVETINALKIVGAGGAIKYVTDQVQNRLQLASASLERDDLTGNFWVNIITYRDKNDNEIMSLRLEISNGAFILKAIFNDGTQHNVNIASWSP